MPPETVAEVPADDGLNPANPYITVVVALELHPSDTVAVTEPPVTVPTAIAVGAAQFEYPVGNS
ncbi:MAG: Uncharacterised protein [Flavobacteriales bacterium UBA4585]|nr:MAG: Uncharacterised protein [Flavobacteriales bacterium UBA4585]